MQFVANGLGVAIVPSAVAKPFKETGDGAAPRIGGGDDGLPPWRISIFRRMKQKHHTGTDTVDLFLAMLPDHLPH
jgi:DNA-binding transcriptional LysR family regulator